MPAKKSFKQLIEERNEILWAPCIYDCVSAKCAEQIGFEAVTISSCEQMHSFVGFPSMTQDEMYTSAANIIRSTNCAVLVDGEDGGGTPMEVYKNVKRYAEAGAMAISIEDMFGGTNLGVRSIGVAPSGKSIAVRSDKIIPKEIWAANIQAAVEACKGTECIVIARIDSTNTINRGPLKFRGHEGISFEDAIERAQLGVKMGAQMTMIQNICYRDGRHEWEEIQKRVPGWHFYPDIHADDGIPDVADVKELYDAGFQVVSCHCFQKGAWKGMLEYGRRVFEDKSTVYTENDNFGYPIWQLSPITFPEMRDQCNRWVKTIEEIRGEKADDGKIIGTF